MTTSIRTIAGRVGGALLLLIAAAAVFKCGADCGSERRAQAEVQSSKPPTAFKSGGARSEIVLREIADMLKTMDARLEKIEQAAVEMAKQSR